MQSALKNAANVPLGVMELCYNALEIIEPLVGKSNVNAAMYIGVGALSLKGGLLGAWLNVKINLGGIKDVDFVNKLETRGLELVEKGTVLADKMYIDIANSL